MIEYSNKTTQKEFEKYLVSSAIKMEAIENDIKTWQVSNGFHNWRIVSTENSNNFSIYYISKYDCDQPYRVDIISKGNRVQIHKAEIAGREIKADRLLRNFSR